MLNGVKKQKTRRVPSSKNVEEKLVRDKCSTCKKLFLAFRPTNNQDSKTCDDCLSLKDIPVQAPEINVEKTPESKVEKIPEPFPIKVPSPKPPTESSNPRLPEFVELPQDNEKFVIKETSISKKDTLTTLPCRLGSYSVRHKIMHNGNFLNAGDIVSVHSEGTNYYAQITAFVESIYCEKFAALIWLLPTSLRTDKDVGFDPFSFTYGPEDESFYDVGQLKFVMHPPTQFYRRFLPPVPINSEMIFGVKHRPKIHNKRKN